MNINFDLWLLIGLVLTSLIAGLDKFIFAKRRTAGENIPVVANYASELWSVLLLVFILRGFVFGLITVPTGSMLPTIQLGDYIIVNKLAYALKRPVSGLPLWQYASPQLGDVIVFNDPVNPDVLFIKTVVGVPGDHISYLNKQLLINGKPVPQTLLRSVLEPNDSQTEPVTEYVSQLGQHQHHIYQMPWRPADDFKDIVIPAGEYFVMGDNRDNSDDSRYWGLVPEQNIVGKGWRIVFSWDSVHNRVRWQRLGNMLP